MRHGKLKLTLLTGLGATSCFIAALTLLSQRPAVQAQPPADQAVVMDPDAVTIRILFGLRDTQPTVWSGDVAITEGQIVDAQIWRSGRGDRVDNDSDFQLQTRTTRQGQRRAVTENGLVLSVNAPNSAAVLVSTNRGDFRFTINELVERRRLVRLERQASADLVATATALAATDREEDFPAAASAADGSTYAVYVEHTHLGDPHLNPMPTAVTNFAPFRPRDGGDRLMFCRLDGNQWSAPRAITDGGLDLWRPTVAVDGQGSVWVVWSQNVDGNWDLYARRYDPTAGQWSSPTRLTSDDGADVHVVAARSAAGAVWLAWQGWRDGQFDILVGTLGAQGLVLHQRLGSRDANQWNPAIAANSAGRVAVAYDTYEGGNYDVVCSLLDQEGTTSEPTGGPVAGSPQFEVRPSVAFDQDDRLWIAWEERAVNWGKDDWGAVHPGPGSALYRGGSAIRVAYFEAGKYHQTEADIFANTPPQFGRMNSYPRIATDPSGRVWLAYRHRGQRRAPAGTFWESYVTAYDGTAWSTPAFVTHSDNLLDNRPALLADRDRLLLVYSGDGRNRYTQAPQINNQLYVGMIQHEGEVRAPSPRKAAANPESVEQEEGEPAVVHPNETEDIARIRGYRLQLAGKTYRFMRGEFHRHTEISGDGGGDGSLEDMWRYGLDAARMDWIGNGDHDNGGGREYTWWITQKTSDIFHHAPNFVPMFTYERSVRFPDGHRNVMFAKRGIRTLPRLRPQAGESKPNNVSNHDTPMLYRYLKHFDGICAVHTSATDMGTDWRDNDPEVEPIVEIYQGDRQNYEHLGAPRSPTEERRIGGYQPDGFVWNALEKGYRLGFQASSDHISTHISYAVAVVEEPTRQGILEAFKKRHCYGATDNIIVAVTSGQHMMGDQWVSKEKPSLEILAIGTAPLARVSVVKDLKYAYQTGPNQQELKIRWTDHDATEGQTSLYYVRLEQEDGQLAWASPMWITYQP